MNDIKTFFVSFFISYTGLVLLLLASNALATWCGGESEEPQQQDQSAQNVKLLCTDCNSENSQLFDPVFNIRETAKQLILLEDHLAHTSKHCVDCVSKHLLFAEGLLEEAVTLDKKAQHLKVTTAAIKKVQAASAHFAKHRFQRAQEMQQMVRQVRKELVKYGFDSIVASK